MTGENIPRGEFIGIVIGAVVLFTLISAVPILIMWHHRRRQASRGSGDTENLEPETRESPIEQWIEGQNAGSDVAHHLHDPCDEDAGVAQGSAVDQLSSRRPDSDQIVLANFWAPLGVSNSLRSWRTRPGNMP
ncbi:hypothetical protein POX_f07636 [Penicillium oxalicum]|uniref:hypothetical protein n=1 Tax=Penicillium oxalicum TaxID=69781 RepID=UPI0020B81F2B|nr:hypothetical protein POX_f07636 [Penicillium oxalicum]KAI2787273.1 hypothetical protein POX_f07636 [Penicillium oxalicum]